MRSSFFNDTPAEAAANNSFTLPNSYMLRTHVTSGRDVIARKGSMVAYRGDVAFKHEGARTATQLLKKFVSKDDYPLMRVSGAGEVFFGSRGAHLHLVELEGDAITINGSNLLAFDGSLSNELQLVRGAGFVSGGMWNTVLSGAGTVAVASSGTPIVLDCSDRVVYADMNATVAWSANLTPQIKSSVNVSSFLGRGSGEALQYAFQGPGFVIVQPSENL